MRSYRKLLAAGLLIGLLMPCTVSAMGIEAAVGGWNQDSSGDFSYNQRTGLDNLSIKDNLGYGDKARVFGRVKLELPLFFPNIYLMATPMSFDGTGSKNGTFQFGNTLFNGNVPFTSSLKLDHYDIGLYYGIPGLTMATAGILNVDVGLDARVIDFKAELTGSAIGGATVTQSQSLTLAVPMLYLGMQMKPVKWLSVEGEARGTAYGGDHYYDLIGRAKVKPFGPLFVAAGYRYEEMKIDAKGIKADANFGGPFGEAGFEF